MRARIADRTYSQDEIEAMLEEWRVLGRPPTREERDALLERRAKMVDEPAR